MRKTVTWSIIVIALVAGNAWQYITNNHRANSARSAISHEMMAFIPALHNAVSFYDQGNLKEAAIQVGIASGEMQCITIQLIGTGTPQENAGFVAEYLRNSATYILNNDAQSKKIREYIKRVDALLESSKTKEPYDPSQLPGQLQQMVKTMPSP